VSGYVKVKDEDEYRHWVDFEPFLEIKHGAVLYNLDTDVGQSGSPAYLIFGDRVILVGIHNGCSKEDNLNYCTMINEQIFGTLKQWIQ
jgi:V8-like Glu-specific endopeptidase